MKIQIISYRNELNDKFKSNSDAQIKYTSLNAPESFDMFDVNFVSLQSASMWSYYYDKFDSID